MKKASEGPNQKLYTLYNYISKFESYRQKFLEFYLRVYAAFPDSSLPHHPPLWKASMENVTEASYCLNCFRGLPGYR